MCYGVRVFGNVDCIGIGRTANKFLLESISSEIAVGDELKRGCR